MSPLPSLRLSLLILVSTAGCPFARAALDAAVIASTSAGWSNYRHASDALAMTRLVSRLGLPASRLRLLMGAQPATDARNPRPGNVYTDAHLRERVYDGHNGTSGEKHGQSK